MSAQGLTIALGDPCSAEGRAFLRGSDAALAEVYGPEEIFTLTPEELARAGAVFLIARLDGRPAGCISMLPADEWAELKRLYVCPEARGRGIARALVRAGEAAARERGLATVRLETGPELGPAVALYRRLGYRERGPFPPYAPHPASIFMERELD